MKLLCSSKLRVDANMLFASTLFFLLLLQPLVVHSQTISRFSRFIQKLDVSVGGGMTIGRRINLNPGTLPLFTEWNAQDGQAEIFYNPGLFRIWDGYRNWFPAPYANIRLFSDRRFSCDIGFISTYSDYRIGVSDLSEISPSIVGYIYTGYRLQRQLYTLSVIQNFHISKYGMARIGVGVALHEPFLNMMGRDFYLTSDTSKVDGDIYETSVYFDFSLKNYEKIRIEPMLQLAYTTPKLGHWQLECFMNTYIGLVNPLRYDAEFRVLQYVSNQQNTDVQSSSTNISIAAFYIDFGLAIRFGRKSVE